MTDYTEQPFEDLSAYLDGELPAEQAERVGQRVASDETLRAELDRLRATRQLLAGLDREAAPDGLADAVLAEAQKRGLVAPLEPVGKPAKSRWPGLRAVSALAAMLLIGVGLALYFRGGGEPSEQGGSSPAGPRDDKIADATNKPDALGKEGYTDYLAMGDAATLVVNTVAYDRTNSTVLHILHDNGIRPAEQATAGGAMAYGSMSKALERADPPSEGNFYVNNKRSPDSNEIVVVADRKQAQRIVLQVSQLDGETRVERQAGLLERNAIARVEQRATSGTGPADPSAPAAGPGGRGVQARDGRAPSQIAPALQAPPAAQPATPAAEAQQQRGRLVTLLIQVNREASLPRADRAEADTQPAEANANGE